MKNSKKIIFLGLILALTIFESCVKDLDRVPYYDISSATVYNDPANYRAIIAKVYAGLAVSGQEGPAGKPDISGIDEGFSTYLRQYYKAQELTTDEAVIGWNDGSIKDYHNMKWSSGNEFISAMYYRMNQSVIVSDSVTVMRFNSKIELVEISLDESLIIFEISNGNIISLKSLGFFDSTSMFVKAKDESNYVFILKPGTSKPVEYSVISTDSIPTVAYTINMHDTISVGNERTTFIEYPSTILSVTDSTDLVIFNVERNMLLLKHLEDRPPINSKLYVQVENKLYQYHIKAGKSKKLYYKTN